MKFDFLNKELIASYTLDNHNFYYNRTNLLNDEVETGHMMTEVRVDGRKYYKEGKFCIQTITANVYKSNDKETRRTVYMITCGLAKQNQVDLKHDKKVAGEESAVKAFTEPIIQIQLDHKPSFHEVKEYVNLYFAYNTQQYVFTAKENATRDFFMDVD